MKEFGFLIAFFIIIIFLALSTEDGQGIFSSSNSTSTSEQTEQTGSTFRPTPSYSNPPGNTYTPSETPSAQPSTRLSEIEVERRLADISRNLDTLSEDVRRVTLRSPASPYVGLVTLSSGNARDTEPEREYLMLRANNVPNGIAISDWYLESYVTEESAAIPSGDRVLERWRSPQREPIILLGGESAYILTTDSPIDTSFHENSCTGYLQDERTFYPYLTQYCPAPINELKDSGRIDLDNDSCYDFVERMQYCKSPDDAAIDAADVNGVCTRFIEETFNYNSCVELHENDPLFDNTGYWYIYLDRNDDLWREKREIIRLMDENDRVIDVIEY